MSSSTNWAAKPKVNACAIQPEDNVRGRVLEVMFPCSNRSKPPPAFITATESNSPKRPTTDDSTTEVNVIETAPPSGLRIVTLHCSPGR